MSTAPDPTPPVRLASNDDGSLTLSIGESSATISRAAWSKLIAPARETDGPAALRAAPAGEGP